MLYPNAHARPCIDGDHGAPGQRDGGHDAAQVTADQGDVGGGDGDVGSGPDGDPEVGGRERRGVVGAVAAHGDDVPFGLQAGDLGDRTSKRDDVSEGSRVTELFETSLAHHAAANPPYDRARVQPSYGELLRRNQRRVDTRSHIRAALDTFEDLHAEPLVERAAQELRTPGEPARKRDPSTAVNLTAMERKVAELVSQGLSNKDVAALCSVSRARSCSTCATCSPRPASPHAASSPTSISTTHHRYPRRRERRGTARQVWRVGRRHPDGASCLHNRVMDSQRHRRPRWTRRLGRCKEPGSFFGQGLDALSPLEALDA